MRILDYAWSTFSSIAGTDHSRFRLVLSEEARRPLLGREGEGYSVTLPVPRKEKEGIISVQGLYADADEQGWSVLWRIFRASLYHSAFHLAYGNLGPFVRWAKGKEQHTAVYVISLLEDYRITLRARETWPGAMSDIAFANYIGASRMVAVDEIESRGLRLSTKLLLALWGVSPVPAGRADEDQGVLSVAERARGMMESSLEDPASPLLEKAADLVYALLDRMVLPQIPAFPHTEAHSGDSIFGDHLVGGRGKDGPRLEGALAALGVERPEEDDEKLRAEFSDSFQAMQESNSRRQKMQEYYARLLANTHLGPLVFPREDLAAFLRARSELAGPIRNIKNQLLMVKNVTDEDQGKESGQVDLPMAMQVIASGVQRSDVFVREEPLMKDEAWGILVDASKSVSSSSMQLRGIATCLAEVANSLMRQRSRWGLFGFNDRLQLVKDFDEQYSSEAKARIGGLDQSGGTYLPDALSVVSKALNSRPVESKFLVVVSDCRPAGYAGIEEATVSQVSEIARKGINLIGVGVESPEVKKYFKVNSVLSSPYEMMKFFVRSYLELTGTG